MGGEARDGSAGAAFAQAAGAHAGIAQVNRILHIDSGLPARLAELLAARVGGCGDDARAVLAALAVAGRPLTEDLLGGVAGLPAGAVRGGLRELGAARLLAEDAPGEAHRPRHLW
jgi:hypothetical protein